MKRNLGKYVIAHTMRGACMCGQCIDAGKNPEQHQPDGHTVDLVIFKVAMQDNPTKESFSSLAKEEFPQWFDGKERGYMEIGHDMGDQGIALMTMGLGHLLGVWTLTTPKTLLMDAYEETLGREMVGAGMISICVSKEKS